MAESKKVDVGEYSKFTKVTMVVISMLLIFVGPTYVPYAMSKVGIDAYVQAAVGGVLFVLGIVFLLYIVQKKIINP